MKLVENFDIFAPVVVPPEEYFSPGHRACQGCGEVLAVRLVCKALGPNVIISMATGCMEIVSSPYPHSAWRVPWLHVAFENAAAVASGVEAALRVIERKGKIPAKNTHSIAMGGDGGTTDIGLQSLSGMLERGHDVVYVCYDNEAYMNTGVQRSSSTPFGAMTTTSPPGKMSFGQSTWKKNVAEIAVAHKIPYVATASPSYPIDLINKIKRAVDVVGPAYVHVLSVCPTGWRSAGNNSIKLGRLAVESAVFPLYEVKDGKYRLTIDPPKLRPVSDYLKLQGRFRHLTPDLIEQIQKRVTEEYGILKKKCEE